MAANHAQRASLGELVTLTPRVHGALLVYCNTVGAEATGTNVQKAEKRTRLIARVLQDPAGMAAIFARALAGSALANDHADTGGTDQQKLDAISDAEISAYVAAAWDIIAGVQPWERA